MQSKPRQEITDRLVFSFGLWTELALLSEPIEFLWLQSLNRYAYKTSISRAQMKFKLTRPICYLSQTYERRYLMFGIYPGSDQGNWAKVSPLSFDIKNDKVFLDSIMVGISLVVFQNEKPVTVRRYSNLKDVKNLTK